MWQGIEREQQRYRRKRISVDSIDEVNRLPVATAEGAAALHCAHAHLQYRTFQIHTTSLPHSHLLKSLPTFTPASSAPESCFAPQPGEPSPWMCRHSKSLHTPHPVPTTVATPSPSSSTKNAAMVERMKASRILTSFPLRCPSVSGVQHHLTIGTSWLRNLVSLSTLYCMPRDSLAFLC